jgi:hypothetical protein
MHLNIEAITNVLDALSFVLITPEFLGDKRLQRIKTRAEDFSRKIYVVLSGQHQDPMGPKSFFFTSFGALLLTGGTGWFAGTKMISFMPDSRVLFVPWLLVLALSVYVLAGTFFIILAGLVAQIAAVAAVRWIMLNVGAFIFMLARGLMVWQTW